MEQCDSREEIPSRRDSENKQNFIQRRTMTSSSFVDKDNIGIMKYKMSLIKETAEKTRMNDAQKVV